MDRMPRHPTSPIRAGRDSLSTAFARLRSFTPDFLSSVFASSNCSCAQDHCVRAGQVAQRHADVPGPTVALDCGSPCGGAKLFTFCWILGKTKDRLYQFVNV